MDQHEANRDKQDNKFSQLNKLNERHDLEQI